MLILSIKYDMNYYVIMSVNCYYYVLLCVQERCLRLNLMCGHVMEYLPKNLALTNFVLSILSGTSFE